MKVWCKNLLCHARPVNLSALEITEEYFDENYNEIKCPACEHKGMMPDFHILTMGEITLQVTLWGDKILYIDAFKQINYNKLPKNMDQQKMHLQSKQKKKATSYLKIPLPMRMLIPKPPAVQQPPMPMPMAKTMPSNKQRLEPKFEVAKGRGKK